MTNVGYQLTRRAARDVRAIHAHSRKHWGDETANRYTADLYAMFATIAERPQIGEARQHRSGPFLMAPARQHFVVYDRAPDGVVILTILHQARHVEQIIADLAPSFRREMAELRERGLNRDLS